MADLTRLKQLEEELRQEIEGNLHGGPLLGLLKQYFDTLDSIVTIIRQDGIVLFFNKTAIDVISKTGLKPDELIGKPCMEVDIEHPEHVCTLEECVLTKKIVVKKKILSKYSNRYFDLVCMPLKYNGVSAVVEIWTLSD